MNRERISKKQDSRIYYIMGIAAFRPKRNHRTPQLISSNSQCLPQHCLLPGKGWASPPRPSYSPAADSTTGAGNVRCQPSCQAGAGSIQGLQPLPAKRRAGDRLPSLLGTLTSCTFLLNNRAATWARHVRALGPDDALSRTKILLVF